MKKYIFTIFVFIVTTFCIIFPSSMIDAAKTGITLWWKIILPSLFPFMILSNLVAKTALPRIFGKLLNPITQLVFNLPGISSIAIFLGMVGGYPVGAKVTADLRENNNISSQTANHLIKFTNNSGPLFISGAIGLGLYNNVRIGTLLLITHYLSALLTGFLLKNTKKDSKKAKDIDFEIITISKLGSTLSDAVKNSIFSVVTIGGFIVLFSIISKILLETGIISAISKIAFPNLDQTVSYSLITGLLEVTNGVSLLSVAALPLKQKLVITAFLVGFGGFSIHAQTLSVIAKTDIKISSYILGKTTQGIIAGALTYLALLYTNFSEILLTPVFSGIAYNSHEFSTITSVITGAFVFTVIFKTIQTLLYSHYSNNIKQKEKTT